MSPHPPVVSPHPPVVSPHPPVVSPHPPVVSPHPPVVSPHPPVVSPHPSVMSPHPPRKEAAEGSAGTCYCTNKSVQDVLWTTEHVPVTSDQPENTGHIFPV